MSESPINHRPHPEEHRAAMRLEGWPRVHTVRPTFETAAQRARPPQDEVCRYFGRAAKLGTCQVSYVTRSQRPMIQPLQEISAPMRDLSAYMARASRLKLPAAVEDKARHHVLDTLAAMVSGSRLAPGRLAIAYVRRLGGTPEASIAGSRVVTPSVNSPPANGLVG